MTQHDTNLDRMLRLHPIMLPVNERDGDLEVGQAVNQGGMGPGTGG